MRITLKFTVIFLLVFVCCKTDEGLELVEEEISLDDDEASILKEEHLTSFFYALLTNFPGDPSFWFLDKGTTSAVPISPADPFRYQLIGQELYYFNETGFVKYNLETGEQVRVADLQHETVSSFQISPDKRTLAYSNGEAIFLLDLVSGASEHITLNQVEGTFNFPQWSPDGSQLLISHGIPIASEEEMTVPDYIYYHKIYSLESRSFREVELIDPSGPPRLALYTGWMPDGQSLIYISTWADYSTLCLYDLTSSTRNILTPENFYAFQPVASPDGKKICFFGTDKVEFPEANTNYLAIYDVASGAIEVVNDHLSDNLSWNSSSDQILYSSHNLGIKKYDLGTSEVHTLVEASEDPIWYVSALQLVE